MSGRTPPSVDFLTGGRGFKSRARYRPLCLSLRRRSPPPGGLLRVRRASEPRHRSHDSSNTNALGNCALATRATARGSPFVSRP